jgi:tRNA pseudouridine38-40 synthase
MIFKSFVSVFDTIIIELSKNMFNFKIIIEYDGASYHGWQRQKNANTVQAEIEAAIKKITKKQVSIIGSGRTDAGVHAFGQVANFLCATKLSCHVLKKALNSVLPKDIVIKECKKAADDFHARFCAKSKIYNYCILNSETKSAIFRNNCWSIKKKLNLDNMKKAASLLIGTHDFKAFEGAGSSVKTSVRTVLRLEIIKQSDYIIFEFKASGFLRHMVRNIVGTLVDVGLCKISIQNFKDILKSKNRNNAGITAPAHGLFLMKVFYEDD